MRDKKGYTPWNKGKSGYHIHSEEYKRKLSELNNGEKNPMFGRHHSKKTKMKISQNKERAKKISKALKGRKSPWNIEMNKRKKEKKFPNISKSLKKLINEGKYDPIKNLGKYTKLGNSYGKGRICSEETKRKISKANKGKKRSEEYKKGRSKFFKKLWQSPEYREKVIKNTLKGLMKRPTSLEKQFIGIIEKYNLPFAYCGNGSLLIGYKNPDFYETNGKKICIEVANKREKSIKRKRRGYKSWQEYKQKRINHFKKWGWGCIVLFEDELKNENKILKIITP